MRNGKTAVSLVFLMMLYGNFCTGQNYIYDYQTTVAQGAHELKFPFAGGLNTPQFSSADLNQDGIKDLFIFDRTGNKVLTFINGGTENEIDYFYWQGYQYNFPAMENWAVLRDYNCDGLEDIFTSYDIGIKTFLASYDGYSVTYTEDVSKMQYAEAGFTFDLGVGYIDVPGFADINFDGDLDVLTFNLAGGIVDYYENQQIEKGLDCGTWDLEHVNSCWGNFYESGITYAVDLDYACKGITNFRDGVHAGSTFMIFDQDADHDMDVVLGDLAFGNLNFLVNGGDNYYANIVAQDTTYPSYSLPYDLQIFPAAFYIDLNNDDKKDMVVSPNNANLSENFKNVWYYKNISLNDTVLFDYETDTLFVGDMIDAGERSFPAFFDYNNDGLQDLFIGDKGYYNAGDYIGQIALYENTGTATDPKFSLVTRDFEDISIYGFRSICPTFADLDNDGDVDMLIGEEEGTVHYFKNIAPAGSDAEFVLAAANYQGIDPGQNSTPQLIDINNDGLVDLIIGEKNGNLNYYENTGTAEAPLFTLENEFWGNVDVRKTGVLTGHSAPELIKAVSGDFTLYVGCEEGTIYEYDPTPDFTGAFTKITSAYNDIDEGSFSSVRFKDITGDGINELITGNERGGLTLYRDENTVGIINETINGNLHVYPDPASNEITIMHPEINKMNEVIVYDLTGRIIKSMQLSPSNKITIPVNDLRNGMYFIRVISHSNNQVLTARFIKNAF